jgi:hypothetical protein
MSVRRKWTTHEPVRILALLPLRSPTDAASYVIAIAVDVDMTSLRIIASAVAPG